MVSYIFGTVMMLGCTVEIIVYVDGNVDVGIRMALFVLFVVSC